MWKEWQIKIVESYKQDKTIKEIAEAVGKSEAAVKVYMYRKGVAVKKKTRMSDYAETHHD